MNWTKDQIETLYKLRNKGHSYEYIGRIIGKSAIACKRYAQRKVFHRSTGGIYKQTICWDCIHAVPNPDTGDGCSWSEKQIPVEGWKAEGTRLMSYANDDPREFSSYLVTECPRFKQG